MADSKNSLGWLEVVGEVENQAAAASTYTQVTGTFFSDHLSHKAGLAVVEELDRQSKAQVKS